MLRKNLPMYILITLTLAAIIFLSPKIIGIISADSVEAPLGLEILTSNNFEQQPLDKNIWGVFPSSQDSTVNQSAGFAEITCGKSEGQSLKISQKAPVSANKFYKISINYLNENLNPGIKAQFGFLKDGPNANIIESKAVIFSADATNFVSYSSPKLDHANSYFFFKCTGIGTLKVKGFSVEEYSQRPAAMATVTASVNTSTATITPATPTPLPSATATRSASITPAPTITTSNTTISKPIASSSQITKLITPTIIANQVAMQSSWNIFGTSKDIKSDIFTKKNMTVMQMFAGSWIKITPNSKKSMILNSQGGIYVFNPSTASKSISVIESSEPSSLIAGKGWNILYNSSENEQPLERLNYDFMISGKKTGRNIEDMVGQNLASKNIYLLKQATSGVGLTKIDLTKTKKIPAKTGFWFYIF